MWLNAANRPIADVHLSGKAMAAFRMLLAYGEVAERELIYFSVQLFHFGRKTATYIELLES